MRNPSVPRPAEFEPAIKIVPSFCRDLRTIMVALISKSGMLLDANRGFIDLFSKDTPGRMNLDIHQLLVAPKLDELSDTLPAEPGVILYQGAAHFGKRGELILNAIIRECSGDLLLVAEYYAEELRNLSHRLAHLNNTLTNLRGELTSLSDKLQHQHSVEYIFGDNNIEWT